MFKTMLMSFMLRALKITIFIIDAAPSDNTTIIVSTVKAWGEQIKLVLNSVVAVCVIGGGFLIFMQYMQGNDQAQKNFIKLIIGVGIMKLITYVVGMFAIV